MKEAVFTTIHAPANMDQFMKAADLFRHKNLGIVQKMTISYKEDVDRTLNYDARTIVPQKLLLEKVGQIVSFVNLDWVQNGNVITVNDKVKPYYDEKAREISDGHKSFLFWEFINATTPFKCEISETSFIKEIIKSNREWILHSNFTWSEYRSY